MLHFKAIRPLIVHKMSTSRPLKVVFRRDIVIMRKEMRKAKRSESPILFLFFFANVLNKKASGCTPRGKVLFLCAELGQ